MPMVILEYFVFCSGGSFPIYLEASEIGDHFLIFPDENFIWKGYQRGWSYFQICITTWTL